MIPVVSIVGSSGCGKTTLIESLIPRLADRGFAVGTVKHSHHRIDTDRPGKDSYRHQAAGARATLLAGTNAMALFIPSAQLTAERIQLFFSSMDLVLVEGLKRGPYPKIEVFRAAAAPAPVCLEDPSLVALVSDDLQATTVTCFGLHDYDALADFIVNRFLAPRRAAVRVSRSAEGRAQDA